jgi:hypothetical protein
MTNILKFKNEIQELFEEVEKLDEILGDAKLCSHNRKKVLWQFEEFAKNFEYLQSRLAELEKKEK